MMPAQCRAARGFLGWTQFELADVANVSRSSISNFEAELQTQRHSTILEIRTAFESAGLLFIDANGQGTGVGARKSNWPAMCRAARSLLGWMHSDVAAASGVCDDTVMRFEAQQGAPRRASLKVIRRAFEAAGVVFVEENGRAFVSLRKTK